MSTPKPGDKVRVTYEAEYQPGRSYTPGNMLCWDLAVEVIEPADDPSKDPIGTVRAHDGHQWVRINFGEYISCAWVCVDWNVRPRGHYEMQESTVVGAVPGTPAAEAER
jgi:hypothetical protein